MAEYIDKDYLLNEVGHTPFYNNADKDTIEELIMSVKVEDVAPVIHAEWLAGDDFTPYKCSRCYESQVWDTYFCPCCGAKMDLGGIE